MNKRINIYTVTEMEKREKEREKGREIEACLVQVSPDRCERRHDDEANSIETINIHDKVQLAPVSGGISW